MKLIRLRDLPGVQRATDLCRNPRHFDYPQSAYTAEELAGISIRLFGIPEWETWWNEPTPTYSVDLDGNVSDEDEERAERDEYEAQFGATRLPWAEAEVFWQALGWDMSDGKGAELISAHCFARQIIAVEGELVDGAKLTLNGSGRWTPDDDVTNESLEERLKREADEFMLGRLSGL